MHAQSGHEAARLLSNEWQQHRVLTDNAIQGGSELMRYHGQELLLGLHTDFQILNLLQPASVLAQEHQHLTWTVTADSTELILM